MFRLLKTIAIYLIAFLALIYVLPGSILLDIEPKDFSHPLPQSFDGGLKQNNRLSQSAKLLMNNNKQQISGPESIAVFGGRLVTGGSDGFIYEINANGIKPIVKLVEKSCDRFRYETAKCGRPAGMRFDSKGTLYVVELSFGVFSVENIFESKPKVNLVLDIQQTQVLGKASKFLNDLVIDEGKGLNGGHVLYITDVSTKFDLTHLMYVILGSDTGRVIKYDINAKKVETVIENLFFPNGIEISDDKNALLVNEMFARQVLRHYIKGVKTGETEVLVKHLPGEPDNIRRSASKQETYWLPLFSARTAANPSGLDYLLQRPFLRKILGRLLHLFGNTIEFVGKTFNNPLIKEYGFDIKTGQVLTTASKSTNNYGLIVEVDSSGNIINSLHSPDGSVVSLSEVREIRINDKQTVLYLGSYENNYIGKVTLDR